MLGGLIGLCCKQINKDIPVGITKIEESSTCPSNLKVVSLLKVLKCKNCEQIFLKEQLDKILFRTSRGLL